MTQQATRTGLDAATEDKAWALRVGAARGENTPISIRGWLRIVRRVMLLVALLIVCLPLHYLYRVVA